MFLCYLGNQKSECKTIIHSLPAALHCGYGLPSIPSDIQPLSTRHAHSPVVASHAV